MVVVEHPDPSCDSFLKPLSRRKDHGAASFAFTATFREAAHGTVLRKNYRRDLERAKLTNLKEETDCTAVLRLPMALTINRKRGD
jgi:hypothetical protein